MVKVALHWHEDARPSSVVHLSFGTMETKMPVAGQCRLCLKEGMLQDSHFIPQAAYRLMRSKGKNPHPVVAQKEQATRTSAQMRAHVFCRDCEQRFHKNGEDTFFRYCYRGPGRFKLLQTIRATAPVLEDARVAVHIPSPPNCAVLEEIGYFGVSVLWKSACYAWNNGSGHLPSIPLGPYQEQLRRFLLGEEPFPASASLVIEVSDENNRLIRAFGTPGTIKKETNHVHFIHVCGIRFNLMLGKRMPPQLKQLCAFKPPPKIALISKNEESDMAKLYRDILVTLGKTRDLNTKERA